MGCHYFRWGFAVFAAVYLSGPSGAHLNPAVLLSGGRKTRPGCSSNSGKHCDLYCGADSWGFSKVLLTRSWPIQSTMKNGNRLGIFATGPAIKSYG